MFGFLNPWGLLALSSLGGVLFLYFYVFRGRRREVSALFLWDPDRSLRAEGRKRRRPPVTIPLLLELLAALLLSLAVAGLYFHRADQKRHLVVLVDASASMNAAEGSVDFSTRAAEKVGELAASMSGEVRVSLVESFRGRLMGDRAMRPDRARELLREWEPSAPPHGFSQAGEVARSLQPDLERIVLITDRPTDLPAATMVGVGEKLPNTGWISGRWTTADRIFARAHHFGAGGGAREVVLRDQEGRELSRRSIDFSAQRSVPLTFRVPAGVNHVVLELPPDALANDNVLRLTRPERPVLPVRVEVQSQGLSEHLNRALRATGKARRVAEGPAVLLFSDQPETSPRQARVKVRFHTVAAEETTLLGGPYFLSSYSPLTRGLDLKGAAWAADEGFGSEQGQPLVWAGEIPLVEKRPGEIVVNLTPTDSNLFRLPAWPVLISNLVDEAWSRHPGLKRFSYRSGENLSFVRPGNWTGETVVETPVGKEVIFDGPDIFFGRLEQEGVYRIYPRSNPDQRMRISVNLLAEQESDLTPATSFGEETRSVAGLLEEDGPGTFHRILSLLATGCLLGCWYYLERRRRELVPEEEK